MSRSTLSRSFAAAVCLALADMGCDIFFTHWVPYDQAMQWGEEDGPDYLQSQVRALGVRCEQIAADLSQPDAHQHIMNAVEERLGSASILVNNATHDDTDAPFDQLAVRMEQAAHTFQALCVRTGSSLSRSRSWDSRIFRPTSVMFMEPALV